MVSKELLDLVVCPECKGNLEDKKDKLFCAKCNYSYEIKNGIPILLPKRLRD